MGTSSRERQAGISNWGVIFLIVLFIFAALVAGLITLLLPNFRKIYSLGFATVIRNEIQNDYSRIGSREPIPAGPLFKEREPAYQVANQIREMLREIEKHVKEYDEGSVDWESFFEVPYKRSSVSSLSAYRHAREILQAGLQEEEKYFKNYFSAVDRFSNRIKTAAGSDSIALEIAEGELRAFRAHRFRWGQFVERFRQWITLARARLDLLWKHRRYVLTDSSGHAVLAPGAGESALTVLENLDRKLEKEYDALQELWDAMELPR